MAPEQVVPWGYSKSPSWVDHRRYGNSSAVHKFFIILFQYDPQTSFKDSRSSSQDLLGIFLQGW